MKSYEFQMQILRSILILSLMVLSLSNCKTTELVTGGAIGATIVGGTTPSHQIEQVYYLGVFDPHEQLPPTIYRVIVRGQAAAISNMRFGSGWVPARLVDSLATNLSFNDKGEVGGDSKNGDNLEAIKTGRRLMMFGPEGFRKAPKDHRLAIVMGASPEDFFQAMDTSLLKVSRIQGSKLNAKLKNKLFEELIRLQSEKEMLNDINNTVTFKLNSK